MHNKETLSTIFGPEYTTGKYVSSLSVKISYGWYKNFNYLFTIKTCKILMPKGMIVVYHFNNTLFSKETYHFTTSLKVREFFAKALQMKTNTV